MHCAPESFAYLAVGEDARRKPFKKPVHERGCDSVIGVLLAGSRAKDCVERPVFYPPVDSERIRLRHMRNVVATFDYRARRNQLRRL